MKDEIIEKLIQALNLLKAKPASRETASTITKVEEAILWYGKATE